MRNAWWKEKTHIFCGLLSMQWSFDATWWSWQKTSHILPKTHPFTDLFKLQRSHHQCKSDLFGSSSLFFPWSMQEHKLQRKQNVSISQRVYFYSRYSGGSRKHCLCSKFSFFKMYWQILEVFSQLSPLDSYLPYLRAFKWGTVWRCTSRGSSITHWSWKFNFY